jgi:hypothetical protein
MSCPSISTIPNTEYIGNSLPTINNNFQSLKDSVCDNQSQITNLHLSLQSLDAVLTQLSSYAFQGIAKLWVKFSGTNDADNVPSFLVADRHILNSLGISSVYRKSIGDYRIYFSTPLQTEHYNFSVCNKETLLSGKYYYAQVYNTQKEYLDIRVKASDGSLSDSEFISLIVFL